MQSVAAATRAVNTHEYDVIISDIGLLDGDGCEFIRQTRKDSLNKTVPCIALSGFGLESDKRQSLDAGFDCHVLKPVDFDALLVKINSFPRRSDAKDRESRTGTLGQPTEVGAAQVAGSDASNGEATIEEQTQQ